MDMFGMEGIEEIDFCAGTQLGKTECENNMICYAIAEDPGPMLMMYPTEKLAKFTSENRLQPMFRLSPAVRDKFLENNSSDLELQFVNNYLVLIGSNSPADAASRPVRYVFEDEVDKYPKFTGKDASPDELVSERQKTFYNKKKVRVSSPTKKDGNIWKAYTAADMRKKYHVPCPFCGHEQRFEFKHIKWPKDTRDPQLIRYSSWYECEKCGERIDDRHKMEMLRRGKWRAENVPIGRVRSIGYHLNSIYSPWLTFGDVAAKFIAVKDKPEELMNFVNGWLAEPWEEKGATLDRELVLQRQTNLPEMVVPDWAQLLTGGVDVQQNRMYWTARAWGAKMTSQNIAHGVVETWADLEKIMNRQWPDTNGELRWQVNLCAIDSGYDSETVYEFCLQNQDWAVAVKGSSNPMLQRYRKSKIESVESRAFGQPLYLVDVDQYKNLISARLNRPLGDGCFMVHADCDGDYADQLTSEQKITTIKGRNEVETWVKKTSAAQNHYLDCEVYAALAADLLHVRYLEELQQPESAGVGERSGDQNDDWIPDKGGNWL